MVSIWVRVHAAIARGDRGESGEIELARLGIAGPFCVLVGNQPVLLLLVSTGFTFCRKSFQKNISHAGLEMHLGHTPHRSDIVVRILRKP